MTIPSSIRRWRFGVSAFLLAALTLVFACKGDASKQEERAGKPSTAVLGPLAIPQLPMLTKPTFVVSSMNGTVTKLRRLVETQTDAFSQKEWGTQLVSALVKRAHFLGTVSDYAEAEALAARLVEQHATKWPALHVTRARVLAATHRFDEATAALDAALAAGAVKESDLLLTRCSIWLANGEARRVWEALREPSKKRPTPGMVFMTAVALADLGESAGAEREFRRSLTGRSDGAAEPVVKKLFHWGRMWERQGKRARAKALYARAFEIFPVYAPLVSHMAALEMETGELGRAIELIEPIVKTSDDPEYRGQLAGYLATLDPERSKALLEQARAGYDRLLATSWRAFADHAARFYLGIGNDAPRALELATRNLENRKADESYQLYLDAAGANEDSSAKTCAVATSVLGLEDASAYALLAASRTLRRCGDVGAADKAMARAEKAPRER